MKFLFLAYLSCSTNIYSFLWSSKYANLDPYIDELPVLDMNDNEYLRKAYNQSRRSPNFEIKCQYELGSYGEREEKPNIVLDVSR